MIKVGSIIVSKVDDFYSIARVSSIEEEGEFLYCDRAVSVNSQGEINYTKDICSLYEGEYLSNVRLASVEEFELFHSHYSNRDLYINL